MDIEKHMKRLFLIRLPAVFLLMVLLSAGRPPLQAQTDPAIWRRGETLTYKVRWSFFRLGTLRMQIADSFQTADETVYRIDLAIDSNPLLFFLNRHYRYTCLISESFKVQQLTYLDNEEGTVYSASYVFNHALKTVSVVMTDTSDTSRVLRKTIRYEDELYDGLSLIYFVRQTVTAVRTDTVHYIADDGYADMIIDFQGEAKPVGVSAFSAKQQTCYIEGMVFDKGIAGLSGKFKGWFGCDAQRLPLKAALKVFIGSVIVELEKKEYAKERLWEE